MKISAPAYLRLQTASRSVPLLLACIVAALLSLSPAALAQSASHATGWVVIPADEYRSLHARAFPAEREAEPPPVEATLSRVDYDLLINTELAAGRATLTVDVLKDGWVRVPIPPGLLVREAKLDGKPLSLVPNPAGNGAGQLAALLSHPGRAVLILDIALPVAYSTGEESIALPSTASGVTRASVQLPRQGVDVRLTGGLLAEKSESAADSKWLAYARGNEPLTFTWRRKTEDHRASQPLRLRGSLTQLLGLGEDATSVSAEVNVEVTQGAAREVRLRLPEAVTINQVSGAMVADWEVKAGELAVTFLEPVEQNARFVVTGETHSPREGLIEIPILRLLNAERETGGVAVEVLGAGEIKDLKTQGLENADASDLGEMIASRQSPSLAAFRFRSGDAKTARSLSVNVARYTPQAVLMANVEEARYNVLISNDGKVLVQARYAVRNNQRNFLKITLPPGAALWSASLAGSPVRPGQAPDGGILLPLEKARAGEDAPVFAAEVVYLSRGPAWSEKGQFKLALPALDLPVSRTGLVLYEPPLFKVTPALTGPFRTEPYEDPSSVALTENPSGGDEMSVAMPSPPPPPPPPKSDFAELSMATHNVPSSDSATDALLKDYRSKSPGGKVAGILPIRVSFPAFGPSIYLVSELTSENQAPVADLSYQRDKKAGGK